MTDLKHLSEKCKKNQEESKTHKGNSVKLAMFGRANIASQLSGSYRVGIARHNEDVDSNRAKFSRIIDCVTVFKGTSSTIQNELLDCMLVIMRKHIVEEIKSADFLAIEANETTDMSQQSQC